MNTALWIAVGSLLALFVFSVFALLSGAKDADNQIEKLTKDVDSLE